jgi:hypothetical protein
MDSHIVHARIPRNEIPPLSGLPLLDWRPSERPAPSPVDLRAERIGKLTGRPPAVVKIHMIAAGLGGGVR